ncbi:MAG TPA: DUF4105 domain-containing protein [Bacteroidales bacterium]|nr:DUF4105 domain-containing protein [Bacteroidales bacterium]
MRTSIKHKLLVGFSVLMLNVANASSQTIDTTFYLITCGPGTETYSIYGHSALRMVCPGGDIVYNWGVFDFDTPNFAWKFAKGRLNYLLAYEPFDSFLRSYLYEERYVIIQRINLNSSEKAKMFDLINLNLQPENLQYRYDFFYDDCSTRIRDLIEKSVGDKLSYADDGKDSINPTFRQMLNKYQVQYPWLDFGIDMLIGVNGDKKADFRDRMFLPIDMMAGLSDVKIAGGDETKPLLGTAEMVLDFDPPSPEKQIPGPVVVFSALFMLILIFSFTFRKVLYLNIMDGLVFLIFSIFAILMMFFNFFTDHEQMRMNLNIIWANPVLILCLLSLVLNRNGQVYFRIVFFITAAFLVVHLLLPQEFNTSNYPLILILLLRSSARSDFKWNPLTIKKE